MIQPCATGTASSIAVRALEPAEAQFVSDSWRRSYEKTARRHPLLELMPENAYRAAMRIVVARLLPRSVVLAAYLPSVAEEVLGYIVFEARPSGLVVHWLYTKQPFRRAGVAKLLLGHALGFAPGLAVRHSHETDAGRGLALKLKSHFTPSLAR